METTEIKWCPNFQGCAFHTYTGRCLRECIRAAGKLEQKTNFERVKEMTIEEMAEFIYQRAHMLNKPRNKGEVLDWLKEKTNGKT